MKLRETNGDQWELMRLGETTGDSRDQWGLMRLRETNGDQLGLMRPMGTHENLRDEWGLMRLRDYWRLMRLITTH